MPTPPVRVLVPYLATYFGGVRRILGLALPRLARVDGLALTYAELCADEGDMAALERDGVRVDRRLGVPGPSALSRRSGVGRALDLGGQVPRLARMAWRLSRRLPEHDVCWVHGHRELLVALAARALAGRSTPPIVWHWHGPPLTLDEDAASCWSARQLTRHGAARTARVVAISDFCAGQAIRMGAPPGRVVTIANAAEVAARRGGALAAPLPARGPGEFTSLVACASVRRHKGVHLAVAALARLPRQHVLWITGDTADPVAAPYVRELEGIAARSGVSDRVRFIGARRDVHAVMAAVDAVLVPSIWEEPFGLVAAEAQLVGVPVVASRRGALPELMDGGRCGVTFDPRDPGALAAALDGLARDPARRAAIAASARAAAAARYGYDRWIDEVTALLFDVAGRSRPAAACGQSPSYAATPPGERIAPVASFVGVNAK